MNGFRVVSAVVGRWIAGGPEQSKNDGDKLSRGLRAAVVVAQQAREPMWLVTTTARELQRYGVVSQAFGESFVRPLRSGQCIIDSGVRVCHATAKTIRSRGVSGSVLTIYPSAETLAILDDLTVRNSVIVVPGPIDADVQPWIDAWGPIDLLEPNAESKPLSIADPDVLAAVVDIVSHLTGLGHPSDEKFARDVFAKLRRRKRAIDPREIRAFVVRETGWGTYQADRLAKIAAGRASKTSH